MQTNYVAPVAIGESMHDRFMRGMDRVREQQQMNQVLQQQAIKEKAVQEADYSGIYNFKTEGWSQEYKDAFLQLQNHVMGKTQRAEYKDGEFNQAVQQLYNQWESIDRLWRDTKEAKANFINVLTNKEQFEDDSTMIIDTPEDLNQKIEMSRTWGLMQGTLLPDFDNMIITGEYPGLGRVGMDIVAQNIANPSFFNYQTAPKAQKTPDELAVELQGLVKGLADEGISRLEIENRVKDVIINNVNANAYGRSPQVYFENKYGTTQTLQGIDPATSFANDTWELLQTYWPEDTTGSGSGDEEVGLTPQDIRVYDDPERGGVRINGLNFPKEKEFSVNFGVWTQENPTVIREAFLNANLDPKARNVYLIPQSILYSEEKGTYTVISPATHTGESLSLDITLEENKPAHQLLIDEIERKFRDTYRVNCSLKEIASRACPDIEQGTAPTTGSGWGSAERVE
jgi:hypothetical protein